MIAIEIAIEIGIDHPGTVNRQALPEGGSLAAQMRHIAAIRFKGSSDCSCPGDMAFRSR